MPSLAAGHRLQALFSERGSLRAARMLALLLHNRVARIMRENHLRAKMKRKRVNTTDSNHSRPVAENVLKRQFQVMDINRVWAGDITYVATREGWLYLAVVLDLHSRKVVGWSMSQSMETELVTNAMDMALQRRNTAPGLLFHSDRGSQYASQTFQEHLKGYGMTQSMSRRGNCYDNACSESFFRMTAGLLNCFLRNL